MAVLDQQFRKSLGGTSVERGADALNLPILLMILCVVLGVGVLALLPPLGAAGIYLKHSRRRDAMYCVALFVSAVVVWVLWWSVFRVSIF